MIDMEERLRVWTFRLFWESLGNTIGLMGVMRTPNLLMASLSEGACKPLQTFVETISGCSAGGLNVLEKVRSILGPLEDVLTQARCLKL
jgi:hypothetical protein